MLTSLFVAVALLLAGLTFAVRRLRRALAAEHATRRLTEAALLRDLNTVNRTVRAVQQHHRAERAVLADAAAVIDRAFTAHHRPRREGDGHA
ncbi:hypothetical protein [Streptomyces sp. NPDC017529]|uniref:hypothetical protein n=1 Tax=Streptomyces sp. NPDC017529 TaxID=3365000 RepID=UPI0037A050E9